MFYLTTHSTHFIYGYMASDIWLRTILIVRKETHCRHIGYSYRLTARVLLYAPSHRQDNTYHCLCYTSRGALAAKVYVCGIIKKCCLCVAVLPHLSLAINTMKMLTSWSCEAGRVSASYVLSVSFLLRMSAPPCTVPSDTSYTRSGQNDITVPDHDNSAFLPSAV